MFQVIALAGCIVAQTGPPIPPGATTGTPAGNDFDPADPEDWPDWTWRGLEENWVLLGVPDPHNVLTDWWAYPGGPDGPVSDELDGLNAIRQNILFTGFLNAHAAHATARAARDALWLHQLTVHELAELRKEFAGFRQDDFADFSTDQNLMLGAANVSLDTIATKATDSLTKLTSIDSKLSTTNSNLGSIVSNTSTANSTLTTISARISSILVDTTAMKASVASIDTKATTTNTHLSGIKTDTAATVSQLGTANVTLDVIATKATAIDSKLATVNTHLSGIKTDTGSMDTKFTTANGYLATIATNTAAAGAEGMEELIAQTTAIKGLLDDPFEEPLDGEPPGKLPPLEPTPEDELPRDVVVIPAPELPAPHDSEYWFSQLADFQGTQGLPLEENWGQSMNPSPTMPAWSFLIPITQFGDSPVAGGNIALYPSWSWFNTSGWRGVFQTVIILGASLWSLRFIWRAIRKA